MDFWDGSANSLALLDDTHSTAGYTQAYIHRPEALDDMDDLENARPLAFTDYRTFGSNSDLIILTSDYVCFHLHSDTLQAASHNDFNHMLQNFNPGDGEESDSNPMFTVSDTSIVFTMIVCAIYGLPFAEYSPSFETLDSAVDGMKIYGLSVGVIIASGTPLYEILLAHAETCSLELYALAAYHDLYDLAVVASSYLLSFQLSSLSDEMAARIGALYLKRLFFMHLGRAEALRRFLLPPPYPHPPTETCDHTKQMALTRAWALAASSLAWDPRVDVTADAIRVVLTPLGDHLTCEQCQSGLEERINTLTRRWASTKVARSNPIASSHHNLQCAPSRGQFDFREPAHLDF